MDIEISENTLAIAHWGEHANGGGDRLAWELARVFENAPFYVGWKNEDIEPDDIESTQLIDGRVLNLALRFGGPFRQFAHLLGWQISKPLRQYETVVTSGNEPLFYVPPTEQTWVAYIHHTNRRQSDQIEESLSDTFTNIQLLKNYAIRVLFDHNISKPDRYIVNSEIVKRRVMRYWGVPEHKIGIVYPPVKTESFSPDHAETSDYYLTLSRLDWHKNIDEIINTFNNTDQTLIVAGDGPERTRLEKMAEDNIKFFGFVDENKKRELLSGAKAFVFNARDEDFGIAPVEALASGTPVLGIGEGMTQFQVLDNKNGYIHHRSSKSGRTLSDSVDIFRKEGVEWGEKRISKSAQKFSVDNFHEGIRTEVAHAIQDSKVTPDWYPNDV